MTQLNLIRQARISFLAWLAGIAFLSQVYRFDSSLYHQTLLKVLAFQGVINIVMGAILGLIIVLATRSFRHAGFVFIGFFYGCLIGGNLGFAVSCLLFVVPRQPAYDMPVPDIGTGYAIITFWFLGQVVGGIWGANLGSQWWVLHSRQR